MLPEVKFAYWTLSLDPSLGSTHMRSKRTREEPHESVNVTTSLDDHQILREASDLAVCWSVVFTP